MERALDEEILPINSNNDGRCRRLVFVFAMLTEKARTAFSSLLQQSIVSATDLSRFVSAIMGVKVRLAYALTAVE